jgi:hypothetical protein
MSRQDVLAFVRYLRGQAEAGFVPLTWNGLSFDFDVLAEESGDPSECKALAMSHVDMMFHFFCSKGFPVALDKVAMGMNLPGKSKGVSGKEAPVLWASGNHQVVIDYVAQDVRTTLAVAQAAERLAEVSWLTQQGRRSSMALPSGWLRVEQALEIPEPDTSWMTDPMRRDTFMGWIDS